jgi:chromosome segregation ATPase
MSKVPEFDPEDFQTHTEEEVRKSDAALQEAIDAFVSHDVEAHDKIREIEDRIDTLKDELEERPSLPQLRAEREAAEEALEEARIEYETGEATESDVSDAEESLQDVKESLRAVQAKKEALSRLKDRRKAARSEARKQKAPYGALLVTVLLEKAVEPLSEALEIVETADKIFGAVSGKHEHALIQRIDGDRRFFKSPFDLKDRLREQLREL